MKLSQKQTQQIKNNRENGEKALFLEARVITHLGYGVLLDFNGEALLADWRKNLGDIACNDRILFSFAGENAVIERILPREKFWQKFDGRKARTVASNINQMLLMLAVEPEFQENFIERFILSALASDLALAIFVNKIDLCADLEGLKNRLQPYQIPIFYGSIAENLGLEALFEYLANKQTLLCGQSGVGKSSLIKLLYPDADIWIQNISEISRLGKHTTTNIRLYANETSSLIDTAGVRGLHIENLESAFLTQVFPEIADKICRFNDCQHLNEPFCGVLEALQRGEIAPLRYQNFLQIKGEIDAFAKLSKSR